MTFELRSEHQDIIDAAHRVFGAWRPSANTGVVGSWEAQWTDSGIVVDPRPILPDGTEDSPAPSAAHAVAVIEYAAIGRIVEACDHLLCFHAALLCKGGQGVAIVGASCAGKSTLATGLWQNGWKFLCDDLTIVSGRNAMPGPRRVSLRNDSRMLVGESLWSSIRGTDGYFETSRGCLFQPRQIDGDVPESVALSAIVFLSRNGAPPLATEPNRLPAAHAAMALLPYTNLVRKLSIPAALAPVAHLATGVPVWDLPRAPLYEMVSSVEQLVA